VQLASSTCEVFAGGPVVDQTPEAQQRRAELRAEAARDLERERRRATFAAFAAILAVYCGAMLPGIAAARCFLLIFIHGVVS